MTTDYPIATQHAVRAAFWEQYNGPNNGRTKRQNDQPADCRMAFVFFVDALERDGTISSRLADKVTL